MQGVDGLRRDILSGRCTGLDRLDREQHGQLRVGLDLAERRDGELP